ncbi:MAG: carboxymuconolactone decarboxylase family protein [Deltaproteobacteria bacterium]
MKNSNPLGKRLSTLVALCGLAVSAPALAQDNASAAQARDDIKTTLGFVPGFFKVMSDVAIDGAWQEMKGLQMNPASALSGKTKELIGLAVAAQVPCHYCIYAHTEFAKLNGATPAEIAEAVALAGVERHWSAYIYGTGLDQTRFKADLDRIVAGAKAAKPAATPITAVDAASARKDIEQTFGFVPEFLRRVPDSALPGAWNELESVKLSPNTHISAKHKALISLAVASQVPSEPCVLSETAFAKLAGASEREIQEAVGMAAITRNMSTMLNGQQTDERAFHADIDRLVNGVKAAQAKASKTPAATKTSRN